MKNRFSFIFILFFCIVLMSCKQIANSDDAKLLKLASWMTGSFNSEKQAGVDTNYFNIQLHMKPIWKERSDAIWLYVEQAAAWSLDKPYRQRVYRLKQIDNDVFESAVFTFEKPLRFAGVWKKEKPLEQLNPDSLIERTGCTITLTYDENVFSGSTRGNDCVSSLRGAKYAVSEVRIEETKLTSWDRGFDSLDVQVWGAELGPYIFNKIEEKNNNDSQWFKISQIADRVWLIDDHGYANTYLVVGDKKALLIDTGAGVADLQKCIRSITDLPVMVVNTHGHPDHVGGNHQFSKVHAHPKDNDLIEYFSRKEYHEYEIQRVMKESPEFDSLFIKEIDVFQISSLEPIQEGYIFDLGNKKIEVIEVPGHSTGSIVLLDSDHRLLFTGDNNNEVVWLFLNGCLPIESYLQTLENLDKRNEEFDKLLPGHGDVIDKSFIKEQIVCAQNIVDGNCETEEYDTFMGPALLCTYKRASIAYDPDNIYSKP